MPKIGITGHQQLEKYLKNSWLEKQLRKELSAIPGKICAYSSLAIGADQFFAEIVLKSGADLIAIIPCRNYLHTFSCKAKKNYQYILERCSAIEILDYPSPSQGAFLRAGQTVADRSDVLFAVWDGKPAKGIGGTADIVNYALMQNTPVVHFNIEKFTVRKFNL